MPGARVLKQRSHGERLYNFAKNRNPSIIQRFSGGETIPRQGGCNISRRSHFVCCERQRYNPAFRHGLAKGHNCAEQIPVSAEGLPLESLFQSETCAPRRSFPLRNGLSSIFSRRTARIKKTVRQRRQRADKARKRKNYPDKRKNQWQFLLPVLQAFSSLWQSVDFVNILRRRAMRPPPQKMNYPASAVRRCFFTRRSGRAETCGRLLPSPGDTIGGMTSA